MLYYKVIHFFVTKKPEHIHAFYIGIYDKKEEAIEAINTLKEKSGFCERPKKFHFLRVIRFRKPKLLNRTYWVDGFTTYTY